MWQFPQPQQKSAPTCDFEGFGAIIMDTIKKSVNIFLSHVSGIERYEHKKQAG